MHLKQPGFTYSACGRLNKYHEIIQKFRETGNCKQLYRNELEKACFAHNGADSNSKDLAKRTISNKILKNTAYEIARNRQYDGYERALASVVFKCFDKETGSVVSLNEQIAQELHKPVINKFKRRKVYARFKGNVWAADLAEMGSLFSKNKNVKYLLCVIDVFTKYVWVKSLKDKKGKTVLNALSK